jgi:RND family efflux transporter MFP subunit
VNLSNLKVVADVAETFSGKINFGDAVKVQFDDINKEVDSKISFASKVIDPLNRTFKIEIRLGGIEGAKPNMLAKLKIIDYTTPTAISVPTNAISKTDKESFVMVMTEEKGKKVAKRKVVVTGHTGETRTEITSGLAAGDKVIVTGFQELNDGQEISETINP